MRAFVQYVVETVDKHSQIGNTYCLKYTHDNQFYPRPVLALGYCRCLRLCVRVSVCLFVCQSLACPRDNSGPVQARIAKFGPKCKRPWLRSLLFYGLIYLDLQGQL